MSNSTDTSELVIFSGLVVGLVFNLIENSADMFTDTTLLKWRFLKKNMYDISDYHAQLVSSTH